MDHERPSVTRVPSRPLVGRGALGRLASITVVLTAAGLGFLAGANVAPAPSAIPAPGPTTSGPVQTVPASSPAEPSDVPIGVYHVTALEAQALAQVVRFYDAYDAGHLADAMAMLSDNPRLTDCDYQARATFVLAGRAAVSDYLTERFANSDYWGVEFYQGSPETEIAVTTMQVVIIPRQRQSIDLAGLAAVGGMKHDFAGLLFYALVDRRSLRITELDWGAHDIAPGAEAALCDPTTG
jgi:hypothetical protein